MQQPTQEDDVQQQGQGDQEDLAVADARTVEDGAVHEGDVGGGDEEHVEEVPPAMSLTARVRAPSRTAAMLVSSSGRDVATAMTSAPTTASGRAVGSTRFSAVSATAAPLAAVSPPPAGIPTISMKTMLEERSPRHADAVRGRRPWSGALHRELENGGTHETLEFGVAGLDHFGVRPGVERVALAFAAAQPLMPVSWMPRTKKRWKKRNSTRIGSTATTAAAIW